MDFTTFMMFLFVGGIVIIIAIVNTPIGNALLKFLYRNERVTPSSKTAQNNVRIRNEYNGMIYLPLYVEPVGEDEFDVRVESTEAPYRETVIRVQRDQFKHDPIEVLKSGYVNYRLIKRELLNENYGIDDDFTCDPTLTKEELQKVSASQFKKIAELEGEISNQKAMEHEHVRDIMDYTTRYNNSIKDGDT